MAHLISISGYHIREAGSTAAEELAFTLANGFAYVELAMQAGLPVDTFAPRLSFFFNAHIDFFEEIAKYRAARRIWARWMKEKYGATNERSLQLRFHAQTAGVSLTAQQPEVNIVRTAVEALDAVMGDALEALRIVCILASPAIPETAQTIWERIGMPGQITDQRLPLAVAWGGYPGGIAIDKGEPLFPRRKLTEN
mgnify:CR=1 FL=1